MRKLLTTTLVLLVVQLAVAPPVSKTQKPGENATKEKDESDLPDNGDFEDTVKYHRYLKEVVQALESDAEFRTKLEKAEEADIRTGKIAQELEFVNHQVRTKLDELKREELERLRHLAIKEYQLENGLDPEHLKIAEHVDHENPHTFEIDDLKKLIAKTTEDLVEADRKRKEEFKEYEMQKKFEQELKMKGNTGLNEAERKKYEAELHSQEEKHKKHQPLHHPGSKQQLEEVWEKQDHMENQDFDPKTFFYLHDLDGNSFWDQNEVKTLFLKELDKLYAEGVPEDDLRERAEEMERMREHVFNEADLNKDGLISYSEFLDQTKKPDFQQDPGWQGLDEQQIYSQQEYEEFERRRQEEIQHLIAKGILPPNPANYPPGHPSEQFPPHYGDAPPHPGNPQQGFIDPMGARAHPNEIPQGQQFQGQQQHVQQQQFQGQQVPQQQFQGQGQPQYVQVPQQQQQQQHQQQYQGQVPQQQQQFQGQVPQQQQQQQQHQQQQYQGQVPQQQQQFQGQVPQQKQQQQQQPQQHQQQQPIQGGVQQPVQNAVPVSNQAPNTGNVNVVHQQQQQQQVPQQQQPPVQPNIVQSNANIIPNAVNTHS